jgi:3-oxoacyl-[acyl-carrier-protein] synthase-1
MEEEMERRMIVKISDNIYSPLGDTTEQNYQAVKAGKSMSRLYSDKWHVAEPFFASLFDDGAVDEAFSHLGNTKEYTDFEKICIISASRAIADAGINASSSEVRFFISTTKGNVSLLDYRPDNIPEDRVLLGVAAKKICQYFGNSNVPVVISNACISGVCAQIMAMRSLVSERCKYAVVIGADSQCRFIVSGFQSFKALSQKRCRPYDAHREGLNLGEAAGTIIYTIKEQKDIHHEDWIAMRGAIRNDANHISGPSRTGEGSYRALMAAMGDESAEQIAFVNAHGTATPYNDEMESIAISRAELGAAPVNSMKGYYGHTMGAAGVIEPILSMRSVDDSIVLGTLGYESIGVSHPLILSNHNTSTDRHAFMKLLSGFGGCNAAMLYKKGDML